jgi:hypothetical protein
MRRLILPYPPQDREMLWYVVKVLFGVTIPRTPVCPDHCTPFQAFADAYFRECTLPGHEGPTSRAIWHASRGLAGKSYNMSTLGLTLAYVDGADITILGGSLSQSSNVHEYMTKAMDYEGIPDAMTVDQTATKIKLSNAGRIRPLPASQRNVRGPHPSILLIDEADEMDLDIYDAALGQPLPQRNYLGRTVDTFTVVSSTWQNADGTFTEILRRADEKGQPVYRWCYKESSNPVDGWLKPHTIEDKRAEISAEMWRVEYELGEPSIGNRAFDGDAIDAAFSLKFKPEDAVGEGKGYIEHKLGKDFEEYRFVEHERLGDYIAGADWAKEQDKTIIWVARLFPDGKRELVYFMRVNRRPYPQMIGFLNKAVRYYRVPVKGVWHDSTGLGNVVNDYLDVRARPFPMTGDKRAKLLSDYVNAIEKGVWRIPKIPSAYFEHKYCRTGDLYTTKEDYHLPDTVCAAALAEYAAKRFTGLGPPATIKREGETELEKAIKGSDESLPKVPDLTKDVAKELDPGAMEPMSLIV